MGKVVGVVVGERKGLEGRNIRKGRQGEDGAGATVRQMGEEVRDQMGSGRGALTARAQPLRGQLGRGGGIERKVGGKRMAG